MAQKTKKQHYVPQCYLNAWGIADKHQIHVYDKESDSKRINSIQDVACARYFYDITPKEIFSSEYIELLHKSGIVFDRDDSSQMIERAFAEELEKPYSALLKDILEKASTATPWHVNNCYFISQEQKQIFSAYLTLQFCRIKRVRNDICESANCLIQTLIDMGFPGDAISKYAVSDDDVKNIHIQMLLDTDNFTKSTELFSRLTWILGINRTSSNFYTSDNPIGTWGHVKDPILSMNGLASKGVEVFFPLSPKVILIMLDGSYHTCCIPYERKYVEITESANIDYYNSILAMEADRFIFSCDGIFSLLDKMKLQTPDVFKRPHIQFSWGGKTYYPK